MTRKCIPIKQLGGSRKEENLVILQPPKLRNNKALVSIQEILMKGFAFLIIDIFWQGEQDRKDMISLKLSP